MSLWVCVDSGIALKLVLDETDSQQAENLWRSWLTSDVQPVAPLRFPFEITAVLRKHVYRGTITQEYGEKALQKAFAFGVTLLTFDDLHKRAWDLATQLNRPTAYNAHYLALAEILGCEFWTADKRLYNAAHNILPWVQYLGNFTSAVTE